MIFNREKLEQEILESIVRSQKHQEAVLAQMANMLTRQTHIAKTVVQDFGQTTGKNTLQWQASQQGNLIIHTAYIFIDPNVGGTYILTLGNVAIPKPCPVSGFDYFLGASLILKQNAPRNLVITAGLTAAYISVVLFGESAGDAGSMG